MIIMNKEVKSLSAEAYRSLRTNIQFSSVDHAVKAILVTSSIPGEGKSTVAGNLALSLSQTGKKVLLMDCDLRKPTVHRKFRVGNTNGITDYLVYRLTLDEIIKPVHETFDIITAGTIPPNPAELLGSESMGKLIEMLKQQYDYIIIDTPPLLSVTDPQLMAVHADGTILVVRENMTKTKTVLHAYEALKQVKANVLGTVLNDCKESMNGYEQYYYEYSEDSKRNKRKKKRRS